MSYAIREVLEFVKQNDVKFIRLAFCDIFGTQKNISIMETAQKVQKIRLPPPRHLAGINKIFAIQFCFARYIPFRPFRIFPIAFNKKVLISACISFSFRL